MATNKVSQLVSIFVAILLLAGLIQGELPLSYAAINNDNESLYGFDCNNVSEIPFQECSALVMLFNATGGTSWTNKNGWLQTTTPCFWYGVFCESGHVNNLSLDSNNLIGPIAPEVGILTNLTGLNLYSNQLSGPIPTQLGNLTSLTYLGLDHNQIGGAIPSEFGKLTSLTFLDLSSNQLSGAIPFQLGNLTNLTYLLLSNNQLSQAIPPQLGNLTNLTSLSLNNNQLTGAIPQRLSNLSNLSSLSLSGNQLSGAIPSELGNLTNLNTLLLNENQLSGVIPSQLGNLTDLTLLVLYDNQLSGAIPSELGNLTNLTALLLNENQLSGAIPPQLGSLTNLTSLGFDHNQLSGTIPPQLGNLTNLIYLGLNFNRLSGMIPAQLSNLTNLTALGIRANQLSGPIPAELGNLTNLTSLALNDNQLSGAIPSQLGNLTNLGYLYLYRNQLSGPIPQTLIGLSNLEVFFFDSTQLCEPTTPAFQMWIASIPDVRNTGLHCAPQVAVLVHGWQGMSREGYDCSDWDVQAMEYSHNNSNITEMSNLADYLYNHGYRIFAARWTTRLGHDITIQDASECLREQIHDVTQLADTPEQVVLVAHSMGGLVSRAYIEGNNYNEDVNQIVTLGTPHAGINSLFLLLAALPVGGEVVCLLQPGTCQLTSTNIAWYNLWHQPNSEVTYDIIAGDSNPGFLAPVLRPLDGDNDGFIGAYSANGYFGPTGWVAAISGNNLQRWRTQGSHHPFTGEPPYFADEATLHCLNHFLNNAPVDNCDSARLQRTSNAPTGEALLGFSPIYSGTITNGTTFTLPVTIEGSKATFVTSWNIANLTYTLRTPSGTTITPATVGTIGGTYESTPATDWGASAVYKVPNPQAGIWQAILTFTEVEPPAVYTFFSTMESDIQLTPVIPSSVVKGNPFVVRATLTNASTPISGGQVQATLADGSTTQTITLTETQTGFYEGSLVAPTDATLYSLSITATGDTPLPYAREEITTLVVRDNLVTVNGTPTEQGIDTNSNGLFEALRITIPLNSTVSGPHAPSVMLTDSEGITVAQASSISTLSVGNQTVSLDFQGGDIVESGRDGPYTVALQVVANDPIALVGEANPLLVTRNYAAADFEAVAPTPSPTLTPTPVSSPTSTNVGLYLPLVLR